MLEDTLGVNTKHTIQGDFKPLGVVQNPGYYAHIIEKSPEAGSYRGVHCNNNNGYGQ